MQREDYTRINWGNSFLLHDEQEQSTDIERLKRNCMERSVSRRDPYWSHCFKSTKNKTLNELPKTQQASPKILRDEHIRSFWEAVMIQTILRSNFYNLIFIDEFKLNQHNNTFHCWAFKNKSSIVLFSLHTFSMSFIIAISDQHL